MEDEDDNGDNFTPTAAEIFASEIFPRPDFSLIGFFARSSQMMSASPSCTVHSMRMTMTGEAKNQGISLSGKCVKIPNLSIIQLDTVGLNEMDSFENDSFG